MMARIVIVLLLAAFIAPTAAPREGDRAQELREILGGLEHGMVALERLERRDALDVVRRIADEVRAKIRAAESEAPRVDREGAAAAGERERLAHTIEVMRLAAQALREGERHDAVELLEHAIRARETALEGRRDEEARRLREGAPDVAQQAEVLAQAARLWNQFGHERKAAAVAELARQLQERSAHQAGGGGGAGVEERLSALERRLAEISAAVEDMRQAVRRLKARSDE
jgi:hypothetical protein